MNHIQRFNEYNGEFYFEITPDENYQYWRIIYNRLGIDENLYGRDKIEYSKKVPHFNSYESDYLISKGFKFDNSWNIEWKSLVIKNVESSNYYIYKGLDEWYLVTCLRSFRSIYYKCDQWDGLLKFLSDYKLQ